MGISVLAAIGAAASCGGEVDQNATKAVEVARVLHAEGALAAWLFDGSSAEDGVQLVLSPSQRAMELVSFVAAQHPGCAEAAVSSGSDGAVLHFAGCAGPFGVGTMSGEMEVTFAPIEKLGVARDMMFIESVGAVQLWGHSFAMRYYAHASTRVDRFDAASNLVGTSAKGVGVDLASDAPGGLNVQTCEASLCEPKGGVMFERDTGCVTVDFSESKPTIDGSSWLRLAGNYRKCPGQCPGGCESGSCFVHSTEVGDEIQFDGGETSSPPSRVPLDCTP